MKKFLLPLAVLALAMSACNTTPKYTISGTVEGEQDGTVYLLKFKGREADTLGKSQLKAGKFTIEGTVTETTDAALIVEGKKGRTPVIVENAKFTAVLNPADNSLSKVSGTPNQEIINQYMAINYDLGKKRSDFSKAYSEASQAKDEAKMAEIGRQFDEADSLANVEIMEVVKANPDSYVSALIVANDMYGVDAEELQANFNLLGENAKASTYGQKISERLAKLDAVAIGKTAPDFTLNTPDGTPLAMSDIKGKVKIIDFWASWCGPCRKLNPDVVKLYNKYHGKGLEILGVSLDRDKDKWVEAIQEDNLTWNHVSDLQYWNSAAAQLYAVNSIPHLVLLDENNTIVAHNLHGQELEDKVAEMLK